MVERFHTTPKSIGKEYLNHPLGLTLSTPGLVLVLISEDHFWLHLQLSEDVLD